MDASIGPVIEQVEQCRRFRQPGQSLYGHEYRGRRIAVASMSTSLRSYAENRIAEYPVGRQLTVFVNPADPKDAIVERTSAPAYALALVVLGMALAIGGLVWGFMVEKP